MAKVTLAMSVSTGRSGGSQGTAKRKRKKINVSWGGEKGPTLGGGGTGNQKKEEKDNKKREKKKFNVNFGGEGWREGGGRGAGGGAAGGVQIGFH